MKNWNVWLPAVLVIFAIGGAIFYVTSQMPAAPKVEKVASAPQTVVPASDRYATVAN